MFNVASESDQEHIFVKLKQTVCFGRNRISENLVFLLCLVP